MAMPALDEHGRFISGSGSARRVGSSGGASIGNIGVARGRALKAIQARVRAQAVIKALNTMARLAPARAKSVMGRAVAAWHAEALPRIPVRAAVRPGQYQREGRGQLKKRTQPFVKVAGQVVTGGLMLMTHYAIWLVAGTRRIARGRVMAWREGKPLVTDWPAKREGGNPLGAMPVALPFRSKAAKRFLDEAGKAVLK